LELLIRRFSSKKLEELKKINSKIYKLAKEVAPSIILFTEASDFDSKTYDELVTTANKKAFCMKKDLKEKEEPVSLVDFSPDADKKVIVSLLHTTSSLPYRECLDKAKRLKPGEKKEVMMKAFKYMEFYDTPLREFEYVNLTFDLMVSASCFAQLKRHRMATLTCQRYNPELGVTVPPSVAEIGEKGDFMEIVARTNKVYKVLQRAVDEAADYILTNAHRRRELLKLNARELFHISRLREDMSAQWEIRRIVKKMSALASKVMPLTCLLIGGKDVYPQLYKRLFGKHPKSFPPLSFPPL